MWPLIGIGVVIIGFALRFNPLLVVVVAALASGIGAGLAPLDGGCRASARRSTITAMSARCGSFCRSSGCWNARAARTRALCRRRGGERDNRADPAGLSAVPAGDRGDRADDDRRPCPDGAAAARADGRGLGGARANPDISPEGRPARCGPWRRRPTMSGCSSARISFSPSPRSCSSRAFSRATASSSRRSSLSVWAIPTAVAAFVIHGARLLRMDRSEMIGLAFLYAIAGLMFAGWSVLTLLDRGAPRRRSAAPPSGGCWR